MSNPRESSSIRSGGLQTPPMDDLTLTQDLEAQDRAASLSRPREQPPAAVPGYAILRRIGDGAYGSVWLAREQNTGKQVAIKFYTHRRGVDWSLLNREVEKLAVLYTSRNIIGLLDVGWDADPPYYIMEFLEKGSLAGFLTAGPLPPHEAVRIARSVLHALVHAHGSGILHCDLKPANILLDSDFEPRLCDFGQSRLSNEQYPALGTLFYMAPEQASLTAIPDARWDVYALGALLYHMLTGEPPHRTPENEERIRAAPTLEQRLQIYRQILEESPRPGKHRRQRGVDRMLAEIVDRCLRVDPHKRFANAQSVLTALDQRDRNRARRPLIGLGVIGPTLLLVAMALVFWVAMQTAVETARDNVATRALESDSLSAQLLARSLQREVEDRIASLERIADDDELRNAILAAEASKWSDREAMARILSRNKDRLDDHRRKTGRRPDVSWLFTDSEGFQRWRGPSEPGTLDRNYAYRDYFHGTNREYRSDEPHEGVEPLRAPHLSIVFKSTATLRYMTAISVPVWSEDHTRVIGVIARTAHLNELLDEYGTLIRGGDTPGERDDVNRMIALVDRRDWKLLDHPWMTPDNMEQMTDEQLATLKLSTDDIERLSAQAADAASFREGHTVENSHYRDPAGRLDSERYGGQWLAAFAPVGQTGWVTIVQERRRDALRPVNRVHESLLEHGLLALGVSCVLVPLVWYLVMRGLNDRPVRLHFDRGEGGPSSVGTGTATGGSSQ
ncbi:MAG: protein kinase [Planctomycetaceae bacterium]|nr:protein kinase [Planctomycetaceae bacterium]